MGKKAKGTDGIRDMQITFNLKEREFGETDGGEGCSNTTTRRVGVLRTRKLRPYEDGWAFDDVCDKGWKKQQSPW